MKPEEKAFLVKSDAQCNNPSLGNLLGAYLCDALPAEKRGDFEMHLEECIACWTDVTNWVNLGLAAKRKSGASISDTQKAQSFKASH